MADESGQQQRSKRAKQPTERARLADERGRSPSEPAAQAEHLRKNAQEAVGLSFEALWDHTLQLAATVEEIERAAGSRWCRVPASAGARNFRGRRQLPLLGPRRWGELTEIDVRCAERAPLSPAPPSLRPATPPAPRTYPDHSHRLEPPTPRLHAPLAPHPLSPFVPSCAQVLDVAR